jgi:hypothetical protein
MGRPTLSEGCDLQALTLRLALEELEDAARNTISACSPGHIHFKAIYERIFPFWWMLETWVGAILATFVAGWLYQD